MPESELTERGGRKGDKRGVIARALKLAVLLHRLWVSEGLYEPLRNCIQILLPAVSPSSASSESPSAKFR